ncbi:MAG TPA: GRP family sugar transporter [Candidatus Acidoferrales bacterium]|nr:GRP family sugar transporter [Candidatus Acidoferrales bacterium]
MYTPHTFPVALLMIILSTVCWASWANAFKLVKNYRFELFYWDYAIGIFVISLILGHTMGSMYGGPASLRENIHSADASNMISALIGGGVFNLANLLLVAGIDLAGMAVAFPLSIGIALVVGVVLSYALQPKGNAMLLALGVLLALIAVILDGKAYAALSSGGRAVSRKAYVVCIISGILMGLWAPFVTRSMTSGSALGPYSTSVFFTLGALLSCFIFNIYLMKKPLSGEPVNFSGYLRASAGNHLLGLLGGFVWGIGTVFNLVAASFTGVAISYAIGQASPMVAALWGVFAWHEFRGASAKAKIFLALMFLFYILAIIAVARANTAG